MDRLVRESFATTSSFEPLTRSQMIWYIIIFRFGHDSLPKIAAEAAVAGDRERAIWSYSTRQVREEAAEVISGIGP